MKPPGFVQRHPCPLQGLPAAARRPGSKAEHLLDNRRQALTAAVQGITIAVRVNTLPRLQRGQPWYEIGVDDPNRRRARCPGPTGR
ncbi:hypothetical protein [Streptomyces sp. NPDC054887]